LSRPLKTLWVLLALVLLAALFLRAIPDRRALLEALTAAIRAETGHEIRIRGDLSLSLLPHPVLVGQGLELAGAPGVGEGPLVRAARVEVGVRPWGLLRGRLEPTRVRLDGVRVGLALGRDGRGNWDPVILSGADTAPPKPGAAPAPAPAGSGRRGLKVASGLTGLPEAGIEVTDSILTWEDLDSGPRLVLRDLHLMASPGAAGAWGLHLTGVLGPAGAGPEPRITASAVLDVGETGAPVLVDMRVQIAGLPATERPDAPLELTGRLGLGAGAAIRFDLVLNGLDLDPYLCLGGQCAGPAKTAPDPNRVPGGSDRAPAETGLAAPGGAAPTAVMPAARLPLALDLDGRLSLGRLRVAGLDLRGVDAQVVAKGGELRSDYRVAAFYGGGLAGTLRVGAAGSPIALEAAALGIQAGPLLADLTGAGPLTGRADLSLSVASAGSGQTDPIRGLQGSLALRLREGALTGVDLLGLIEAVRAAPQGRRAPILDPVPGIVLDDLSASVVLAGGILRTEDLAARGPLLRATGRGTLDLADQRLDCRLVSVLVRPPEGRGLKELEGVPIPVLVSGTLGAPVWRVDAASALAEVARRAATGRGNGLLEKIERRTGIRDLDGMLRGLLGR
jgi:hypothetical protein